MRSVWAAFSILTMGLAACQGSTGSEIVDAADVEAVSAAIDEILETIIAGAAEVNAEVVLQSAAEVDSLTMVVGDVILGGYDLILEEFRETYSGLESQSSTVIEKQFRMLGPDVAMVLLSGEGTYTDLAGWTSDPVGMGLTMLFVRQDAEWRLTHVHQSIVN